MAVEANAYALAAVSQAPEPFRRLLYTLFGSRQGVYRTTDFVTTQSGTPAMSVSVSAGAVLVGGTETANQGGYFCQALTATTLTIAASNPTNPRRDIVVARIYDNEYATGPSSAFALEVVTGTPAASPSDPATPANSVVLARVAVAAGATSILNANITDLRFTTAQPHLTALGGVVVCTSAVKPTAGLYQGLVGYETDTGRLVVYNGSAWIGVPTTATAEVQTQESTTSTSFVDLATPGPAVSALTGSKALVIVSAQFVTSAASDGFMGAAVSGASTVAASANQSAYFGASSGNQSISSQLLFTSLTPGVNTFTAKYSVTTGTCNFLRRRISVFPAV